MRVLYNQRKKLRKDTLGSLRSYYGDAEDNVN